MQTHTRGKHTRNFYRSRPYARPRRVPALSTQEAATLVLEIISARVQDGWSLEQLDWPRFCRDSAVEKLVREQLAQAARPPHGD
jgi:hypothetical protein